MHNRKLNVRLFSAATLIMAFSSSSLESASSLPAEMAGLARLAIYYGYPSLVNGSNGDVKRAARVFADYDVVVWGDGIEFTDRQPNRHPEGDPEEHQKALQVLNNVRQLNPGTRFYGYVCLGEIPSTKAAPVADTPADLEKRIRLWKNVGVTGIFLDEAGYDFAAVNRQRQNMAVRLIHELGLSAFMNAYFVDDLFSRDNEPAYAHGSDKNPGHLPSLLDYRDLFLLESFQVKNGAYENSPVWQTRLNKALAYRRHSGTRIFAVTTTENGQSFDAHKFDYAWWSARLYNLDGFGWGEPDFAASTNLLPARRGSLENGEHDAQSMISPVASDEKRFWRQTGNFVVVVDTRDHSVHRIPLARSSKTQDGVSIAGPDPHE